MKKIMTKIVKLLLALALLAVCGVIIYAVVTGNNLLADVKGWWTLFLIIPGLCGLFNHGSRLFSLGLTLFGGIMLVSENAETWLAAYPDTAARVADISWLLAAGVVLLFISALSILRSVFGFKRKYSTRVNVDTNGEISFSAGKKGGQKHASGNEYSAVFSEQDLSFAGENFSGAEFDAIFSSLTADLTEAAILNDCTIEANAIFGTVVIKAGLNANYKINGSQIFGSVSSVDRADSAELPTVTINANSVFGSVEIV